VSGKAAGSDVDSVYLHMFERAQCRGVSGSSDLGADAYSRALFA
jgi:hypothetical protein